MGDARELERPTTTGERIAGLYEHELRPRAVVGLARLIDEELKGARADLLAALEACELAMDTAAIFGVGDMLAPTYRESWAAAHTAARAAIAKATSTTTEG